MLGHQSCTAPAARNLPADAVSAVAATAGGRQRGGGPRLTTTSSPSMRTAVPRAHRVAADAQPGVDRAAAGRDLEVPLVPRAADEGTPRPQRRPPVAELDGGRDPPARAQRSAAVRAAVGERVQLVADPVEADAMAAELDHAAIAAPGRVGEGKAQLGAHAATAAGRSKNAAALRWATASRQSAGSRFSVWRGSS